MRFLAFPALFIVLFVWIVGLIAVAGVVLVSSWLAWTVAPLFGVLVGLAEVGILFAVWYQASRYMERHRYNAPRLLRWFRDLGVGSLHDGSGL